MGKDRSDLDEKKANNEKYNFPQPGMDKSTTKIMKILKK